MEIQMEIIKILQDLECTDFSKIYKSKYFTKGDQENFSNVSIEFHQGKIFFYFSNWEKGEEVATFSKHFPLSEYPQSLILFNKIKNLLTQKKTKWKI